VVLDHPNPDSFPAWRLRDILPALSPEPVAVAVFDAPPGQPFGADDALDAAGADEGSDGAALYFWSPGLEEDREVARSVCRRWPQAALYTLTDEARRSRAFAARPGGADWSPPLPRSQWRVDGCEHRLETEATWAAAVLSEARALDARGRAHERVDLLRAAARRNFAQPDLFRTTAEALLGEAGRDRAARGEALHWALRACQASAFRQADALLVLARAQAETGRWDEAVDTARRARRVAQESGDAALASDVAAVVEGYRSHADPRDRPGRSTWR